MKGVVLVDCVVDKANLTISAAGHILYIGKDIISRLLNEGGNDFLFYIQCCFPTVCLNMPKLSMAASVNPVDESRDEDQQTSRLRRFLGLFWDTLDGDPQERRYVQKLDLFLLSVDGTPY